MRIIIVLKLVAIGVLISVRSSGQSGTYTGNGGEIVGNPSYCLGFNYTYFTTSGCTTFQNWSFSGINGATISYHNGTTQTSQGISVNFTGSGTLTANYNCGTVSIPINASSGPASVSASASSTQIALGQSVTLTATGASYYSWSGPGLSQTTESQVTATPTIAGPATYYADGSTIQGGCATTGSVTVTVIASVDAGPDRTYCKDVGTINLADWGLSLSAGSWSGQAITNNTIDLTLLSPGNYTYTYTRTADGLSDSMILTVQQAVAGSLSVSTTSVCGKLTGTITLSGRDGSVLRWERCDNINDPGNDANWIYLSNQSDTYGYEVNQAALFRAVIQKGNCIDKTAYVTISPVTPIAGTINSASITTSCDLVTGSLKVDGSNGVIKYWERYYDDVSSWQQISFSEILTSISENQNVQFRAASQLDNCSVVTTDPVSFEPLGALGGFLDATSTQTSCGSATGTLTLKNYRGDKFTWESDGSEIAGVTGTSYPFNVAVQASFRVKVERQNSNCPAQYSSSYTTYAVSKGGSATTNIAVQCGTASGYIFLSNEVGTVQQWESSTDQTKWTPIPNSVGQLPLPYTTSSPLTYYRALLQLGSCAAQYSTPATVSVSAPSLPGAVKLLREDPADLNPDGNTYTFHPVFQLQNYSGQIQDWWQYEKINSTIQSSPIPGNSETIYPAITQTTGYRAEVKANGCDALLSGQATFVVNVPFVGTLQVLQYTVVQSYGGNSYSISPPDGVTLADGFSFTANSKQEFFVLEDGNYATPQPDKNFVLEETILKEGVTDEASVYFLNANERASSYVYADGLGKPVQQVQRRISPDATDVIVPISYDARGRRDKDYLPYVVNGSNGYAQDNAINDQQSFYLSPPEKIATTQSPFAVKIFEASPLSRLSSGSCATPSGWIIKRRSWKSSYI